MNEYLLINYKKIKNKLKFKLYKKFYLSLIL